MLKAAVPASREKALEPRLERPFVAGITALTSDGKKDSMLEIVLERSDLAKKVGYDGVVASVEEAQASGSNFLVAGAACCENRKSCRSHPGRLYQF